LAATTDPVLAFQFAMALIHVARVTDLPAIAATARYLDSLGDSQAAGVIVGYLEAHHAGLLTRWGSVNQQSGAGRSLREISATSDPEWKSRGAAVTRIEWIDYTLNALPSE
jgi:hypothetical protein